MGRHMPGVAEVRLGEQAFALPMLVPRILMRFNMHGAIPWPIPRS